MTQRILIALTLLVLAGCPAPNDGPDNGDPTESPDGGPVAVCLEGDSFIADGDITLPEPEGPGDAHEITGLRAEAHDGCDRFVIDLATEDGDPASGAGDVEAEFLREMGVVRVTLRDVEMVHADATDASFDGPLAGAAYAVWAPEGRWTYVDLHLSDQAEAHVFVLQDPARVVVDLRPGGGEIPEPATTTDSVVVLEPRPGDASYPLTVAGYSRLFEANTVVRLEQNGQEVSSDFTTATAWADAWGHYSLTISDGPTGPVTIHVGEHSARDGTWSGAEIQLNMQ